MDKHKNHKEKEKNHMDKDIKTSFDISDADLEKKMEDEHVFEEKRKEERRKLYRRNADRQFAEEKDNIIKENRQLKIELDSLKDVMMRRQADFENYKKRITKQQAESRKMVIRDFARDIILIHDDLLRAIEASDTISAGVSTEDAHRSFVQGVSMITRQMEDTLNKFGVVEIDSLNQEFDPNFHEAVEIETNDKVKCETVTKVYHKGFRIEDLVVRSAKVKVTKPKRDITPVPDGEDKGDDDDATEIVH